MPAFPQSSGPAGSEAAQPHALDADAVAVHLHPGPERATAAAVESVSFEAPKPSTLARPVRDRAEQERAVRDRLVPGDRDVSLERRRRLDRHQSSKAGETITE